MADRRPVKDALGMPDVGPERPVESARVTLSLDRALHESMIATLDNQADSYADRGLLASARLYDRFVAALREILPESPVTGSARCPKGNCLHLAISHYFTQSGVCCGVCNRECW